jgi:hypothetical protein
MPLFDPLPPGYGIHTSLLSELECCKNASLSNTFMLTRKLAVSMVLYR